jgi:hypothetical protein
VGQARGGYEAAAARRVAAGERSCGTAAVVGVRCGGRATAALQVSSGASAAGETQASDGMGKRECEKCLSARRWLWAHRKNDPAYIHRLTDEYRWTRNGSTASHIFIGSPRNRWIYATYIHQLSGEPLNIWDRSKSNRMAHMLIGARP